MRELVSRALLSSHLEQEPEWEVAIDRVGALGRASHLGSLLWHWKLAMHERFAPYAQKELVRLGGRELKIPRRSRDYATLQLAATQALQEWLEPNCAGCKGAGEIRESDLLIVCEVCQGSKKRRYSNNERIKSLGVTPVDYHRYWWKVLGLFSSILSHADPNTASVVRAQLRET